jgi:hypothetical protein
MRHRGVISFLLRRAGESALLQLAFRLQRPQIRDQISDLPGLEHEFRYLFAATIMSDDNTLREGFGKIADVTAFVQGPERRRGRKGLAPSIPIAWQRAQFCCAKSLLRSTAVRPAAAAAPPQSMNAAHSAIVLSHERRLITSGWQGTRRGQCSKQSRDQSHSTTHLPAPVCRTAQRRRFAARVASPWGRCGR